MNVEGSQVPADLTLKTIALLDATLALNLGVTRTQISMLPFDDEWDVVAYAAALWCSSQKDGAMTTLEHSLLDGCRIRVMRISVGDRQIATLHVPASITKAHDDARTAIDQEQMWRPQ